MRAVRIAKSYGINHYRFHTWTPPEAAFAAADIVGMYMQPELPSHAGFAFGEDRGHDDYCRARRGADSECLGQSPLAGDAGPGQ